MKRRTKIATILTAGLLSAALVGVGFAAWTIGGGADPTGTGATGQVQVNSVGQAQAGLNRFDVTMGDKSIAFGTPKTMDKEGAWLQDDGNGKVEDERDCTILVTIDGSIDGLSVSLNADALTGATEYVKWEISGVEIASSGTGISVNSENKQQLDVVSKTTLTSTQVVTIKIHFAYIFGGLDQNPYDYFNNEKYTADLASQASTALRAIYSLKDKTFTFTVTATPHAGD